MSSSIIPCEIYGLFVKDENVFYYKNNIVRATYAYWG